MKDIVNLDLYPLDRRGSAEWQDLVTRCRTALARDGMFNLPDFLTPGARADILTQIVPKFDSEAFTHARRHNIYFRKNVPGIDRRHPALREVETISRTLCGDQIGGPVEALYRWPDFAGFLAATMDKPALYPMDDALAGVNAMQYQRGEALNWHFDRSEFTTTLLLQAPETGGEFEYRSDLRSDDDPNYDGVARLLAGTDPELRRLTLAPGTLNVFKGRNTAHRVTPVEGPRARIISVYSFYDRPGVRFTDEERIGFYGRAA